MFALLFTAAAASTMTPTVEVKARQIEVAGVRATYTRKVEADGSIHLSGTYGDASRTPFHYRVQADKVTGTVGGIPVSFERRRAR